MATTNETEGIDVRQALWPDFKKTSLAKLLDGGLVGRLSAHEALDLLPIDPRHWRDVLNLLLAENNWRHGAKKKGVSARTMEARREFFFRFFRELRKDEQTQYRIDPRSLRTRHIEFAVKRWLERGLTIATIHTYLSHLRVLSEWIRKPGLVRPPTHYEGLFEAGKRSIVATRDRSWTGNGVDANAVIAKVFEMDERVGLQLQICRAFGLRVKEAIMLRPRADVINAGQALAIDPSLATPVVDRYLVVHRGTKGGRERLVPIDSPSKEAAIAAAVAATSNESSHMGRNDRSLLQSYRRYYYVLDACGVTAKDLGVTSHGLRHEYAADVYADVSGQPAPIRGGDVPDKPSDDRARLTVARQLGHGRKQIASAYLGSRTATKSLKPTADGIDESNQGAGNG